MLLHSTSHKSQEELPKSNNWFATNFQLVDAAMSTTNDVPYDYDSIMHYDAYAFSRNNRPTIEPLDDSVPLDRLGQRTHLSQLDLDHIKELYCQGTIWGYYVT